MRKSLHRYANMKNAYCPPGIDNGECSQKMNFSFSTGNLLPDILLNLSIFGIGFLMLIKGSGMFVDSASDLARKLKVSEMVIGLTLVSIGTSLPELASSVYASICNQPDFIVGNIAGSDVTNIMLILGSGIFFAKGMGFDPKLLSRDVVLMNLIFLITFLMILMGDVLTPYGESCRGINRICGGILFAGAIVYCWMLFKSQSDEEKESCGKSHSAWFLLLMSAVSLAMIVCGSKMLVDSVVWVAGKMKISPMLISATIVAFGTSVPELAVTIAGVKKGHHDLVLGNIIGSNIFNVLMIFGICSLIRPLAVIGTAGLVNISLMVVSGLLLMIFMYFGKRLFRWMGAVFLTGYIAYLIYNGICR